MTDLGLTPLFVALGGLAIVTAQTLMGEHATTPRCRCRGIEAAQALFAIRRHHGA